MLSGGRRGDSGHRGESLIKVVISNPSVRRTTEFLATLEAASGGRCQRAASPPRKTRLMMNPFGVWAYPALFDAFNFKC